MSKHKIDEIQVGDWVKIEYTYKGETYSDIGQLTYVVDTQMWSTWGGISEKYYITSEVDWEILSPEQISEYKREQVLKLTGWEVETFKEEN